MAEKASDPPAEPHVDWQTAIQGVEKQVEVLADAFGELRLAVRRLVMMQPLVVSNGVQGAAGAREGAPEDLQKAHPADQAPGSASEPSNAAVEAATTARQALRHAADAGRGLSEGAWPARGSGESAWPGQPEAHDETAVIDTGGLSQAPEDDSAARDEVRRAVEEARAALKGGQSLADAASEDATSDVDARDEVRRAVEQARAELKGGQSLAAAASDDAPSGEDARDEVRRAVEQARAELDAGQDLAGAATDDAASDEDARDEVRRAVKQARAELDAGPAGEPEGALAPNIASAMESAWQKNADEKLSGLPPTLVIEDEDGRVELARVYETLIRLDCAGHASLLNYTPHSVTVGLSASAPVPSNEALESAISAIFGRSSAVAHESNRISVRIGRERGKVA